jgi:hypothetical protein
MRSLERVFAYSALLGLAISLWLMMDSAICLQEAVMRGEQLRIATVVQRKAPVPSHGSLAGPRL